MIHFLRMLRPMPTPLCCIALAVTLTTFGVRAADAIESAQRATVRERMERQLDKPSVHEEREAIDKALSDAGVSQDKILALHHAVSQANLPTMVGSLDAFLFFTRDPEWLAFRQYFAEFLELPNLLDIDAATMRMLEVYDGVVTLPAISELSPKAAAACRHFGEGSWGAALEFPNVSTITPEAAKDLAGCEALLVFPHLRELSAPTARALAKHEGTGLILGGLTTLPDDVADALAKLEAERGLLLPDLVSLDSVSLAKRIARQDHAFFPAVRTLTSEIAKALRGNEGGELSLPAIEEIKPEVAKQLVGAGYYWLSLGGAATLTPEAAAIIANHHGQLVFPGPDSFSAAAALKLAKHNHAIFLPHVASVPTDVLRALANHENHLILGSASALTIEEAAALVMHKGHVTLPAIERLPPEVAAVLAPRIGDFGLPGLRSLNAETAAALAANARDELELEGVTTISSDVAAALAAFEGTLSLPGVTALTADVAHALAPHRGTLVLTGVTEITPEAAEALLARTAPLELGALLHRNRLDSPAIAELIVKHFDNVELQGLTSLTGAHAADIARVLARTRGTLSLPSIKRITPRALEVLMGRQRVELPDLTNVKIVPEVGQRGNDDYIDPR